MTLLHLAMPTFSFAGIASGLALTFVAFVIYRVYLDPLSIYPGSPLWAVSRIPLAYYQLKGTQQYRVFELHKKYGPVVRISPDGLSYISDVWQDIYGKPPHRNTQLPKDASQFYPPPNGVVGLVMEPSHTDHARMRGNISAGFSDKALRDQEPIITKYIDLLVQRLRENCENPVDIVKWMNLAAFDLISDLTFGESFFCLENLELHWWIKSLFQFIKGINTFGLAMKFWPLDRVLIFLMPSSLRAIQHRQQAMTVASVKKRLERPDPRPDFLSHAQKLYGTPEGMTLDELTITTIILIVAGSETTATTISGLIYYLCTNSAVHEKLKLEIRSAFKNETEITMLGTNGFPYLNACINETLRTYPAAVGIMARVTPPEGSTIGGRFVKGNTSVNIARWASSRSPTNFKRPDEFIPERWLGDMEFENDNRKVVQPFNYGPRNCVGKNLALTEMRIIVARLIWGFDLELEDVSKGWADGQKVFMVFQKPSLWVKLTPVVQ